MGKHNKYKNLLIERVEGQNERNKLYYDLNERQEWGVFYAINPRDMPSTGNVVEMKMDGQNNKGYIVTKPNRLQIKHLNGVLYHIKRIKEFIVLKKEEEITDFEDEKLLKEIQGWMDVQYSLEDIKNYLEEIYSQKFDKI